ncbi:hypothetical protein BC938DRAFT_479822 [Jimgerdemannia flammicorona]|uniref:Uncharacterized protein n=1 Tax=Jimgerdemannia flammicorona TaxID=994334 RepID=A0A433QK37_9FUNG|nr:hypothetical protein BC938DRAFT_479822 [Jimgerdemannia flammicorona]
MRVHTNYKTWSRVSIGKTPFRQIFVHTHPVLQKYDGALPPYSPSQRYDCVDRIVRLCRYNQVLDRIIGVGARRDSKSVVWGRREERATTKSIACKLEVEVANLRGHTVLLVGNTVVLAIRDKALRVFQEEGHGVVRLTQPAVSAARTDIHSLYRAYLRIVSRWPEDKLRPSKDMKHVLETRVEEAFRKPLQGEGELDIVEARRQLDALSRLVNNEFNNQVSLGQKWRAVGGMAKRQLFCKAYSAIFLDNFVFTALILQYPLSNKILSPASNPNYYSRLISSLEATKDPKKGFFARLLGR